MYCCCFYRKEHKFREVSVLLQWSSGVWRRRRQMQPHPNTPHCLFPLCPFDGGGALASLKPQKQTRALSRDCPLDTFLSVCFAIAVSVGSIAAHTYVTLLSCFVVVLLHLIICAEKAMLDDPQHTCDILLRECFRTLQATKGDDVSGKPARVSQPG